MNQGLLAETFLDAHVPILYLIKILKLENLLFMYFKIFSKYQNSPHSIIPIQITLTN